MIAIIGGSIAAYTAYKTIKSIDRKAEVRIFSAEQQKPYSKMILPYLLKGDIKYDAFFDILDKDILLNEKICRIDTKEKMLFSSSNRIFNYSKLLIATGASPKKIDFEGNYDRSRIFTIRTLSDIEKIKILLKKRETGSVVIVGGGLVSMEMASALIDLNMKVNVVIRSNRVLSSILSKDASEWLEKNILSKIQRLKLYRDNDIESIESSGETMMVKLSGGESIGCDFMIVGKGVTPNIDLVDDCVRVDKGIIVDRYLKTTAEDVYAAGDVVEFEDLVEQKPALHAIWPAAISQATVAAKNIMGKNIKHPLELSRNIVPVFGVNIFSAGITTNDEFCTKKQAEFDSFVAFFSRKSRKTEGILAINRVVNAAYYLSMIKASIGEE